MVVSNFFKHIQAYLGEDAPILTIFFHQLIMLPSTIDSGESFSGI